jgi:hypothetical protein
VSHTEPSVWHAVVALSTLHEGFSIGGDLHPDNRENQRHQLLGLQQYNKAVLRTCQLLETRTAQATDVAMISCVLFVCYELLQYNHYMVIEHFAKGLCVLAAAPESDISRRVSQLFYRLAIQSLFLGESHIVPRDLRMPRLSPEQPFTNPSDARDTLEEQYLIAYPFIYAARCRLHSREQMDSEYQKLSLALERWERRLQTFRDENCMLFTAKDTAAVELLKIHSLCLSIMLQLAGGRYPESLTPAFEKVINLVRSFLRGSHYEGDARPFIDYSFDLGLIGPLFYTAAKCTSSHVQWMAVLLLHHPHIPSREGMWGREMSMKLAYNIVQIEEELDRDMAACSLSDGLETELSTIDIFSQPLLELGPTWKLKQSRDGIHTVRNYSSYGIGEPRDLERSLRLVVRAVRDKVGKYREEVITW